MAITLFRNLQNLWPFSVFRNDDLRTSKQIVSKLSIPDQTKQFVFAIRDPHTQSTIYILSALNLSERSASDARCLIREIKPDAVLVQAGPSLATDIQSEESALKGDNWVDNPIPTSSFGVIKRCFIDKIGKDEYENVAGNFVLKEIFGTSFHGHLLAAKGAAEEVRSSFFVIESLVGNSGFAGNTPGGAVDAGSPFQNLVSTSLVPKRFCVNNEFQKQMVKALSLYMDPPLLSNSNTSSVGIQPNCGYESPGFAKSIYPLLEDLHSIFCDVPVTGNALAHVQKMLLNVSRGEVLDTRIVSEVYTFRVAVEGLRIALHSSGLRPIRNKGILPNTDKIEFSELPLDEKSHVLFAQSIRGQADKFKTIVAVVDARGLAGLRKHWDTSLPGEVKELVGQLTTHGGGDRVMLLNYNDNDGKRLLTDKPVVAVGFGATAILGASSLTKVVPASTLVKIVTFKFPASLKLILTQTQKALAFVFGSPKIVAPGIATSGTKTSTVMKAAVSSKKIRAVAHSIIASAEKTSVSAMRTAFYEIMRKRKVKPVGFLPWATFTGSIGTCAGLLMYGDGIECAAESLPAASSIASLGRGIQHLHEASQAVMQTEGTGIQKSIESLINRIKKARYR